MSEDEAAKQLLRWKTGEDPPMWQGAVPDTDKLAASIQTDPYGLWWRGSKCEFKDESGIECEFEAAMLDERGYRCHLHR